MTTNQWEGNDPLNKASVLYPSCSGTHGEKRKSWKWKLQLINFIGTVYFLLYSIVALVIGTFVSLPVLHKDDQNNLFFGIALGWYFFLMLFINYLFIVRTFQKSVVDSSTCTVLLNHLESTVRKDWKQCFSCNQLVPPRAKHCPLCDRCILKRDHHCFFAGCCIGFHNQRYFIVFCFYGTLGALYSLFIGVGYLETYFAKVSSTEFHNYFLPWTAWQWYAGHVSIGTLAMVFYVYCCVVTMAACAHYFTWQMLLLYTGQSSYEYLKGIKKYNQSLLTNLGTVFGPCWFLNFVIPMPCSNYGNGIEWNIITDSKQL